MARHDTAQSVHIVYWSSKWNFSLEKEKWKAEHRLIYYLLRSIYTSAISCFFLFICWTKAAKGKLENSCEMRNDWHLQFDQDARRSHDSFGYFLSNFLRGAAKGEKSWKKWRRETKTESIKHVWKFAMRQNDNNEVKTTNSLLVIQCKSRSMLLFCFVYSHNLEIETFTLGHTIVDPAAVSST